MAEASGTWYSCVLTEFNTDSCLNNHRCEIMLKTWKTISLLGALFNTVPFLILCFEPRLRKCRFCGFLLLAFTDFLSLFLKYLSIQIRSRLKETSEITQFIFNILLISANVCSFLHIILLSTQKVIMTACPPRCQHWITTKIWLLASLLAWIVSLGMGTLFMFKMGKGNIEEKKLFIKVYSVTVFTFPTTLLGILLILTPIIKKLKSGPLPDNSDQNTHSHQTASRITYMLAVAYIITTTPVTRQRDSSIFHLLHHRSLVFRVASRGDVIDSCQSCHPPTHLYIERYKVSNNIPRMSGYETEMSGTLI